MLPAQAAELAALTMWADSPHFTMPSIKIGSAMLSAAVPSLHAYHLPALVLFDSTSMLEEDRRHKASKVLQEHYDDIENGGSMLGTVQTVGLHKHFAAGFALS